MDLLKRITRLFAMPIHEVDGALLTGDLREARGHRESCSGDFIALEAFVNHYHLSDFIDGLTLEPKDKRRILTSLADAVVVVWSQRLTHLLADRSVLFYVGGREDVTVRFHVERPDSPAWAPFDPAFLRRERMRVFRASTSGLQRVA
jgi:hypothetical protein